MPDVPRTWVGDTAVLLAGGPSLTAEDVAYVRGKARVVAVNDAYRLAPWADALYAADAQWWRLHRGGVATFSGAKYSIEQPAMRIAEALHVTLLRNTGVTGLELAPDGIRTGQNSGYQAINVAFHAGAARIVLLGYDLQRTDGRAHWFGDHPPGLQVSAALFEQYRPHFATLVEPLRAHGVTVVNCSRDTALTCFPRADLRAVLERAA